MQTDHVINNPTMLLLFTSTVKTYLPIFSEIKMAKKKNPEDIEEGGDASTTGDEEVAGNTFDEEPDFNDPEDFVDDISDEELMPDIMKQMPKVGIDIFFAIMCLMLRNLLLNNLSRV